MGQQQLLLIILGSVIVGIAVSVAVVIFNSQAAATNRDEVVNDLAHYATIAQAYYKKPRVLGGGGRSFNGLQMRRIVARSTNLNGTYSLSPDPVGGSPVFVTLTGIGTEIGNDGTQGVKVVMYVYPDSVKVNEALGN